MHFGVPETAKMTFYLTAIILTLYTVASAEGMYLLQVFVTQMIITIEVR